MTQIAFALTVVLGAANSWSARAESTASPEDQAKNILDTAGIKGGLVVHLGCGDGQLTAAFCQDNRYLVHGLTTNTHNLLAARERIRRTGSYGKISIDTFDGDHLPYVDNGVNLLVISDAECGIREDEILRVLAPGGVAAILDPETRTLNPETCLRKPWPDAIDQWTHYLHDASNNAVADDNVVGPPKHVQWLGGPTYLRHHDHMSGFSAMVSAQGRLFYIIDLGPRWSIQMPPRWTLVARDAFSGVVLWQRPIDQWHAHLWPLKKGPADLMRRLVAVGDSVYVTLGVGQPVVELDAATGRTVRTFDGTAGAEEMILSDDVLFVLVNPRLDAYRDLPRESVEATRRAGATWNWNERPRRLMAFHAATGRGLWSQLAVVAPCSLGAAQDRVYWHDGEKVVCSRALSGESVWASKPLPRWKPMHVLFGPSLVIYDEVVLFAGGEKMDPIRGGIDTMTALSAETGKVLWTAPHPQSGYASAEDLLVVDDLVWCGETTNTRNSGIFTGRNLRTGEVEREFPPNDWQPHMSHHRCYRAKATNNFILTSRTGIEFVDVRKKHWTPHHWVRGSCNYGILPCNGLVYAPPHSCACYLLAKLNGLNALAAARPSVSWEAPPRLEKGSAFAEVGSRNAEVGIGDAGTTQTDIPHSAIRTPHSTDWPTYRGNAARSGHTTAAVATKLRAAWQVELGGKLTPPVIAGGRAFVASIDTHTLYAVDVESGAILWNFAAGGRIDSPPTVWQDRVLFGSADGHVYSLLAADGALAWRFRAAPVDQRLVAYEQLESVWPVHGSVLVYDGEVFCVAGRSMWLDGGMRLVRLDAPSGQLLSETILDDKFPGTQDNLQTNLRWPNLPVALPDVLSFDGRHVYMRSQPFGLDGKRPDVITPRNHEEQRGETAHLFSPTGFLDDSWWHRTYWMYGRSYISGAAGWQLATYRAPAGRILVIDEGSVYGFGRAPQQYRGTPITYHLFACAKEPEILGQTSRPPKRRGPYTTGNSNPTRLEYHWSKSVPLLARAMVATDETLFVAGPPVQADEREVYMLYGSPDVQQRMADHMAAFEGRKGALLVAVSKTEGEKRAAYQLDSAPVFDGLAAARGSLFVSTLDGKLLCLSSDSGEPLREAPDVEVTPFTADATGLPLSRTHPDFQKLTNVSVRPCELGYRLRSPSTITGLALKQLTEPIAKRTELTVKCRPRPGSPPDTPGNGFLAFGDAPEDERLIKCGFRIAGQQLYVWQGPLVGGDSAPVTVKADEVVELKVVVDLANQKVALTMRDQTVEAVLKRPMESITWIGYCVGGVDADFSVIDFSTPQDEIGRDE